MKPPPGKSISGSGGDVKYYSSRGNLKRPGTGWNSCPPLWVSSAGRADKLHLLRMRAVPMIRDGPGPVEMGRGNIICSGGAGASEPGSGLCGFKG